MNAVSVKFNRHDCVQMLKNVKNLSGSNFVRTLGVFQANVKNFVMSNRFGIFTVL